MDYTNKLPCLDIRTQRGNEQKLQLKKRLKRLDIQGLTPVMSQRSCVNRVSLRRNATYEDETKKEC